MMMKREFSESLNQGAAASSIGAFLATLDAAGSRLTVHVRAGTDVAQAHRQVVSATRLTGSAVDVKIVPHKLRHVAAPRSIEHWLKRFAAGSVVFDPTLVAQRARALLQAAQACRREFGKRVSGIYFAPTQRTMYVVMPAAASALEDQRRLLAASGDRLPFALRVTSTMPRGELTAVDAASAPLHRRLARVIRRGLMPGAFALALTSLALPAAANTPPQGTSGVIGTTAGMATAASDRYGVLWGLSVFSDGQNLSAGEAFANTGLASFFGDDSTGSLDTIRRVAQNATRPIRRTIIRDVTDPGAEGGPSGASPGS